ncbi:hypothetical protein, partial [Thermosynechococcus sp. OHK43]|uniref:hypothetical protein n=1 Tax=Thermosynechococcus sp. OHK43 TaxID=2763133 RepID=UPI0025F5BC91
LPSSDSMCKFVNGLLNFTVPRSGYAAGHLHKKTICIPEYLTISDFRPYKRSILHPMELGFPSI